MKFLILIWTFLISAGEISLELSQNPLNKDDVVDLTIRVEGSSRSEKPKLSYPPELLLEFNGQSSEVSIVNGRGTYRTLFHYSLTAHKEGEFLLGPAEVNLEGKLISSQSINVKVQKAEDIPTQERPYFVKTTVETKTPFLNQKILFKLQIYRRVSLRNLQLKLPKFDGFFVQKFEDSEKNYRSQIEGVPWEVTEISLLLFPQSVGEIIIPPVVLNGHVVLANSRRSFFNMDSFFDSGRGLKQVRMSSKAIKLKVEALPTLGRPENFSGVIGKYNLNTQWSQSELKVGDSLTMTITLSGEGNVQDAKLPEIPETDFKIYKDKPKVETLLQDQKLKGRKIFKMAIVPQKSGALTINPIELSFFDPIDKKYTVLKTPLKTFNVGENPNALTPKLVGPGEKIKEVKKVELLGEDLIPLKRNIPFQIYGPILYRYYYLYLIIGLLSIVGMWLNNRSKNAGERIKQGAFRKFSKNLKNVQGGGHLAEEFKEYLGIKLDLVGKALTTSDICKILNSKGIESDVVREIGKCLDELDWGEYGGNEGSDWKKQSKHLVTLAKKIERYKI